MSLPEPDLSLSEPDLGLLELDFGLPEPDLSLLKLFQAPAGANLGLGRSK